MRKPYDTTCDLIAGPGGPSPGSVRASGDCRFVPADGISIAAAGLIRLGWVTLDFTLPFGSVDNPSGGYDPRLADQVAIPSGAPAQWWVIYVDEVLWHGEPLYYRANIALLPIPGGGAWPPVFGYATMLFGNGPFDPPSTGGIVFGNA